ncbi:putative microsomal signal peptidase subunit [Phaeomoniella chlamydospora]|uniref:Signal peptidase complex subunit 3 n=1 Tax=Phaeomoniella chlamydospora TaxID=158046 RepID=A0A0G2E5U8_PHACM|nr:putative microsomal signal peptidase subunit [Phaeomoniella chlamydospora]
MFKVKGRPHYYSQKKEEYAQIKFDLSADFSSLFNWNTKQLFVYVLATYPPTNRAGDVVGSELNEAIVWDTIIPAPVTTWAWSNIKDRYFSKPSAKKSKNRPSTKRSTPPKKGDSKELVKPGVLALKNQKPKYQITDPSGQLAMKQNATLTVGWNIQPWVGALVWDKGLLGGQLGSWQISKGGVSEPWDFPPLKGSKAPDTVKTEGERREGQKLEEGSVKEAVPT